MFSAPEKRKTNPPRQKSPLLSARPVVGRTCREMLASRRRCAPRKCKTNPPLPNGPSAPALHVVAGPTETLPTVAGERHDRDSSRGHRNRVRRRAAADSSVLRDGLTALRERAGARATTVLRRVKAGGEELLNVRKLQMAEELSTIGGAIQRAAETLHDNRSAASAADYAAAAAGYVEDAARYLEESDLDDLIADVQDLVRQQPAVFLAGMFLAGVAAARFIKATEPPKSGRRRRSRSA